MSLAAVTELPGTLDLTHLLAGLLPLILVASEFADFSPLILFSN